MSTQTTDWVLNNARGLEILGSTDHPEGKPIACVVLVHGFKGYKDYGFIPVLGGLLAEAGILVHRFNLSCSGMTNDVGAFARPDLFALDTWNRQVEDIGCVFEAIDSGVIDGAGLPAFLCGHSRGGASVLLTAGRAAGRGGRPSLSGVITINAVDGCSRLTDEQHRAMLDDGFLMTESARTGQELRIDAGWLREQLDDPGAHDVLELCTSIDCPALVLHGDADQAVDIGAGEAIASAVSADLKVIAGGNHVLNMSNPARVGAEISPQLGDVVGYITSFVIANRGGTPI